MPFCFADVRDGLSNTIMNGETLPGQCIFISAFADNFNVSPTTIPINTMVSDRGQGDLWWETSGFKSLHPGGANFAMGDGSVHFFNESIDFPLYNALGMCADAESSRCRLSNCEGCAMNRGFRRRRPLPDAVRNMVGGRGATTKSPRGGETLQDQIPYAVAECVEFRCRRRFLFALLLSGWLLPGCGSKHPTTVPVRGTITYGGGAWPKGGAVFFTCVKPAEGFPGRPGMARFDTQGRFVVTTWENVEGLMPGQYRVGIECWKLPPSKDNLRG